MEQKLETFLTLCRTMHYGRAAEALNLSQPAVSKHIQALETEYGAPLFSYANRRLSKTPQGELLERYAISLRYNEETLRATLHKSRNCCCALGQRSPSAITFFSRKFTVICPAQRTNCSFWWTTPRTCWPSWKRENWTSSCLRAFSTRSATTASFCVLSRTSAFAAPSTRWQDGVLLSRSCSISA